MSRITNRGATGPLALHSNGIFQASTDINLATLVGTRWDLSDGREVMLVSNGATAIGTAGVLLQDAAIVANHQNLLTAYTAYSNNGNIPAKLTVSLGATQALANQYQGGFAVVNAGAGIGQTLRIASNAAAAVSASCAVTLEDGPNTALGNTSRVSLIPPHGANTVIFPTTPTGAAVGVTLYTIAAGQGAASTSGTPSFAFVTTKGLTSAVSDAATVVGQSISPSTTMAGAVTSASGTAGVTGLIGYANQTAVAAEARVVFVNL